MSNLLLRFAGIALAGFILIMSTTFIVNEWELAVKFQLGKIVASDYKPGLYFKWPFINNVKKFDARIQNLDAEAERFLTSEKKNLIVDSFVKWKISDVKMFYTAIGGSVHQATLRLDQIIKDEMKKEFSKRTIQEVVSTERAEIMKILSESVNKLAQSKLGIEVKDVRLKRVDLPEAVSNSVYRRMRAERERIARDYRSRGAEAAERIRADADRQYTVEIAKAYENAEKIRGDGDAKAAEIYAKAYNKNAEFYSLVRSLKAYKASFAHGQNILLLEPNSEFFQYFKTPWHQGDVWQQPKQH